MTMHGISSVQTVDILFFFQSASKAMEIQIVQQW